MFTKEQKLQREYIGDGVYAFFDGTGTPWLETEREFSSHYIAMEHAVINNWMGYLKRFLPIVPMCPVCGRLELKRPEAG